MDGVKVSESTSDMWWSSSRTRATQLNFTTTLKAAAHKMLVQGQEGCCDGASSIQFKRKGSAWKSLNAKELEKAISNSGKDKIGSTKFTFFIDATYSIPTMTPDGTSIAVSTKGTAKGAPASQVTTTVNGIDGKNQETYALQTIDQMNTCVVKDFAEYIDGTAVSYTNWANGEPTTGDQVVMNSSGKWIGSNATTLYPTTVCEQSAGTY